MESRLGSKWETEIIFRKELMKGVRSAKVAVTLGFPTILDLIHGILGNFLVFRTNCLLLKYPGQTTSQRKISGDLLDFGEMEQAAAGNYEPPSFFVNVFKMLVQTPAISCPRIVDIY